MSQQQVYIGIDVSKTTLDVAVRPALEHWSVANREKGIDRLVSRLQALSPALVALEATGGLELAVVAALGAAGVWTGTVWLTSHESPLVPLGQG